MTEHRSPPATLSTAPASRLRSRRGGSPSRLARVFGRVRRVLPGTTDLYVTRLFLSGYVVCTVSLVGLYIVIEAFSKLDRFLQQDESFFIAIAKYNFAMVPTIYTNYLGPIITLGAAMFALTTLHRQNELTPLKASGVSVYRVCAPIFVLAVGFTVMTYFLQESVIPQFKDPIRAALDLGRGKPLKQIACQDTEFGYHIRVREYIPTSSVARGVSVLEFYADGQPKQRIDAHQMEWIPDGSAADTDSAHAGGHWLLHDASVQRWDDDGLLVQNTNAKTGFERLKTLKSRMRLETSIVPLDLETSDPTELDFYYLSWKELKRQYQRQSQHRHLAVKLHHHFAFPMSHVILLLLGIPFVLNVGSKNQFISIAAAFLICALFHFVSTISLNVATNSELFSPILAAWLPILLFGSLGITLFDHLPT